MSSPQPDLPPLVQRAVRRLVHAYAPERVVLFGSYAKGMAHSGSDVDLLVVADLQGSIYFHQRKARQLVSDCFPKVDVVLATPEDIEGASKARSPFLLSILGTGVPLYTNIPRVGQREERRQRPVVSNHSEPNKSKTRRSIQRIQRARPLKGGKNELPASH